MLNNRFEEMILIGNGVIPIKIEEILSTPEDEIKFIVSDVSEKYNSYNYNFPVPVSDGKYPYVAKVTMCYSLDVHATKGWIILTQN